MANRLDIQDATGRHLYMAGRGNLMGMPTHAGQDSTATTGVPTNGVQGWAPGALFVNWLGSPGSCLYVNVGTFASSRWLNIDAGAALIGSTYNANTSTASATATTAQIYGSAEMYLDMTGTLGAGGALTLPTVAVLVAAAPLAVAGQSWFVRIINDSSANFAWTLTTAAGWTLTGTQSIAQNTWRDFVFTLTSLTAGTVQSVGVGTNS